ncbi:MAG TPA: CPBP family intramembrane glutamic endopeptidase [Chloroflexota bacterium]|nr:CPBP family intramembrane glutamic endopeptidase [Chloroflexota bacterium]
MTAGGKIVLVGTALALAGAILGVAQASRGGLPHLQAASLGHDPLLAVGLGILLTGIFVYVFQPAFDFALAQRSSATIRAVVAMLVVIVTLASVLTLPYALIQGPRAAQPGAAGLVLLVAASDIPILFLVWVRILRPGVVRWGTLGLSRQHLALRCGQGLAGGAAVFLASALASAAVSRFGVEQNQYQRFTGVVGAPAGWFVVTLLAGCVLVPFAEELFFRGYIFRTFLERRGPLWGYLFSAGLFALAHTNVAALLPIFIIGLLLAWIFQRTGSLLPGMIAHGINNAIAFSVLYYGIGH